MNLATHGVDGAVGDELKFKFALTLKCLLPGSQKRQVECHSKEQKSVARNVWLYNNKLIET